MTFRSRDLDSEMSPGLTGGRVPWTTDVLPNETKVDCHEDIFEQLF